MPAATPSHRGPTERSSAPFRRAQEGTLVGDNSLPTPPNGLPPPLPSLQPQPARFPDFAPIFLSAWAPEHKGFHTPLKAVKNFHQSKPRTETQDTEENTSWYLARVPHGSTEHIGDPLQLSLHFTDGETEV